MQEILNYEVACLQARSRPVSLDEKRKDRDIRSDIAQVVEPLILLLDQPLASLRRPAARVHAECGGINN